MSFVSEQQKHGVVLYLLGLRLRVRLSQIAWNLNTLDYASLTKYEEVRFSTRFG